jgi:hypothetical protein
MRGRSSLISLPPIPDVLALTHYCYRGPTAAENPGKLVAGQTGRAAIVTRESVNLFIESHNEKL